MNIQLFLLGMGIGLLIVLFVNIWVKKVVNKNWWYIEPIMDAIFLKNKGK